MITKKVVSWHVPCEIKSECNPSKRRREMRLSSIGIVEMVSADNYGDNIQGPMGILGLEVM